MEYVDNYNASSVISDLIAESRFNRAATASVPKSRYGKFFKSVAGSIGSGLRNTGNSLRGSTLGIAVNDAIESVDSFLKKNITIDGAAKSRLKALLNPSNSNGIPIEHKLNLSKMNAKLRENDIPERHIEKASLAYLDGLNEPSEHPDRVAKQYYITSLKIAGINPELLYKILDNARTLDEKDWKKILLGIGAGVGILGAGYLIGKGIKKSVTKKVGRYAKQLGKDIVKGAIKSSPSKVSKVSKEDSTDDEEGDQ